MKIHYVPTVLLVGSSLLILVVGVVLMLKGRAVRSSAEGFLDRGVPVIGEVVELQAKDLSFGREPDTRYFALVRYVPEGATEPIEAVTLTDLPAPPPRVGEKLEVVYDPKRPERVDATATERSAEGAGRTWFVVGALTLLAAVGVAAAWLVLVFVVWTS